MDIRVQFVPLKMSDMVKYGTEQAQIEQIKRGVLFRFIIGFVELFKIVKEDLFCCWFSMIGSWFNAVGHFDEPSLLFASRL